MSFAFPTYARKVLAVLAVFLLWFAVFGTAKLKKKAHYINYSHCVTISSSGFLWGSNGVVSDPPPEDVKALSRRYKFSEKQVRTLLNKEEKRRAQFRLRLDRSHRIIATSPSAMRPYTWNHMLIEIPVTKLTFKQKANAAVGKFVRGTAGVYFKLTGIDFSRKSCK